MTKLSVPEVRFEGFEDEWDKQKLNDLGSTYTGLSGKTKADFGHGNARYITYMNVFSNPVCKISGVELTPVDTRQSEVLQGDFLFTTSSEIPQEVGMSSIVERINSPTYLNSFCFGFRPNKPLNLAFWSQSLRSPSVRMQFIRLAQGISRFNISKTKAMEIGISVPNSNSEQKAIGNFFCELDTLIETAAEKLEKLRQFKKTMLVKMFPQGDETVPEVRFEGFEDEWTNYKLYDFGKIVGGGTPSSSVPEYWDGDISWFSPSEIDKLGSGIVSESARNISRLGLQDSSATLLPAGTLLITSRASIGHVAITAKEATTNQGFASLVPSDPRITWFLYNWILGHKNHLEAKAAGNTFLEISAQNMSTLEISAPQISEQEAIGNFFRELDTLIEAEETKLNKLRDIKTTFLNKMFV